MKRNKTMSNKVKSTNRKLLFIFVFKQFCIQEIILLEYRWKLL